MILYCIAELEGSGDDKHVEKDDEDDENDEIFEKDSMWSKTQNLKAPRVDRRKRQADQYEYTPTKTRCPLLLVADYRFFQEMGGGNTKTTINYLISLIDRVHKIYNDTIWQDRAVGILFKRCLYFVLLTHHLLCFRIKKASKEWDL